MTHSQTGQCRFGGSAPLIASVHNVLPAKLSRGGLSWTKSLPRRTAPNTRQSPQTTRCRAQYWSHTILMVDYAKMRSENCGVSLSREAEGSKLRETKLSTCSPHSFLRFSRQILQKMLRSPSMGVGRTYKLLSSMSRRAIAEGPPKISLSKFDFLLHMLWLLSLS